MWCVLCSSINFYNFSLKWLLMQYIYFCSAVGLLEGGRAFLRECLIFLHRKKCVMSVYILHSLLTTTLYRSRPFIVCYGDRIFILGSSSHWDKLNTTCFLPAYSSQGFILQNMVLTLNTIWCVCVFHRTGSSLCNWLIMPSIMPICFYSWYFLT